MNLKALVLLKLICCGGPLLVLTLSSVGLSGVIAALAGAGWYLVGIAGALASGLLWRYGRRLSRSDPDTPETQARLRGTR